MEAKCPKSNKFNWKKSFRKIPIRIERKLSRIPDDNLVVACVRRVPVSMVADGAYSHLGISMEEGVPIVPERIMPDPTFGRFSRWNVEGREVVRRDLPMVTKTYAIETPNWGDWGYGSHTVYWDRDVYRRDYVPPKAAEISIRLLATERNEDTLYLVRFAVEEVLSRCDSDFETQLLANLNLLQENVGGADVFSADADDREYLRTISVVWEILPPGQRDENLARILSKLRTHSNGLRARLLERYQLLEELSPIAYISGTSGFQRYFGAQFANDLVVFENLEYGNAIYVMFEDWEDLSKRSRLDLLRDQTGARFERLVHRPGWQDAVRRVVGTNRRGRKTS